MRELLRTNDPVRLSRALSVLAEAEIATLVFDYHVSSIYSGAGDLLHQRLMVDDDDYRQARRILHEVGEELPDE
ncbi:MAG: DUF2007 domain-containing protein [Dongiaceae bacterium]